MYEDFMANIKVTEKNPEGSSIKKLLLWGGVKVCVKNGVIFGFSRLYNYFYGWSLK